MILTSIKNYLLSLFKKRSYKEINPDEIFMDSQNLPEFDLHQFEGRLDKPIALGTFITLGSIFLIVGLLFVGRAWYLGVSNGAMYAKKSQINSLHNTLIFAPRGVVYDRNGEKLIWNDVESDTDFPKRVYTPEDGFGNLLGYIKYPAKDSSGFYFRESYEAKDGIELSLNDMLAGKDGLKIAETDVAGKIVSESVVNSAVEGKSVSLSIDSRIQNKMYQEIKALAEKVGFRGGAGIIMDVNSGDILAMTSYPEYRSGVMTDGTPTEEINSYFTNTSLPFLNRITSGLYAPGSIVKPIMAFGALEENIISPEKQILSTGKLVIPNPYFPDQPSIFLDWKAHGWVDMRHAIAVSSDVYFYEIGGGFEGQQGLGIARIEKYFKMFGFGSETGIGTDEEVGNIPTPSWKEKVFAEPWRLGDTYHTAIGQYGMQVTPIQAVRAISAIANEGTLVTPTFIKLATSTVPMGKKIGGSSAHYEIVKEGMRLSTTEGTSVGVNVPYIHVAGKTGTAEIGVKKDLVNSWVTGFFPYEKPHYAFMVVMERGPVKNLIGGTYVMRQVLDWMHQNTPEYFE